MATKYAAQYAKAVTTPPGRMDSYHEGIVQFVTDTYTLTGDLASGNTIAFGTLPAGAKVVDCIVTTTDLDTSGGTLDVGFTGTADGFHANIDVTSAVSARFAATTGLVAIASDCEILATIDGDTDATTGTITVTVLFIKE